MTPAQLTLDAIEARDEAMARVESHSAPWAAVAMDALLDVARTSQWVTSEAVFACLDARGIPRPVEARAMGPVMMRAARAGYIVRDRYERSTDPKHHRDVQTVYRSLVR